MVFLAIIPYTIVLRKRKYKNQIFLCRNKRKYLEHIKHRNGILVITEIL